MARFLTNMMATNHTPVFLQVDNYELVLLWLTLFETIDYLHYNAANIKITEIFCYLYFIYYFSFLVGNDDLNSSIPQRFFFIIHVLRVGKTV